MTMPRLRAGQTAFTLVELLIALALISLITLLLFSGLRLGSRAWESVESHAGATADLRLTLDFITRAFGQMRPERVSIEAGLVSSFSGTDQALEFAAPLSAHVGLSGVYLLRLTLEDQGDERSRLVLSRWLLHPEVLEGGDDVPAWEPLEAVGMSSLADLEPEMDAADGAFGRTVLLEDVTRFEISYYGIAYGDTDPDWHDVWESAKENTAPSLVRIRLAIREREWPDLLVPVNQGL